MLVCYNWIGLSRAHKSLGLRTRSSKVVRVCACVRARACVCARIGCTNTWSAGQANTNRANGQTNPATTVEFCQAACVSNAACTGIDWNSDNTVGQWCFLHGPWSGLTNAGGATGITHYTLTRNCAGKNHTGCYIAVSDLRLDICYG